MAATDVHPLSPVNSALVIHSATHLIADSDAAATTSPVRDVPIGPDLHARMVFSFNAICQCNFRACRASFRNLHLAACSSEPVRSSILYSILYSWPHRVS